VYRTASIWQRSAIGATAAQAPAAAADSEVRAALPNDHRADFLGFSRGVRVVAVVGRRE